MRTALLLAVLAFAMPGVVRAQGTSTVPVDDPLYRDIDRLIDAGIVTHVIVGQRPYSRRMIARIAREARASLAAASLADGIEHVLDQRATARLLAACVDDVADMDGTGRTAGTGLSLLRSVRVDGLATDAPTRQVPSNGLGAIEADLNTLTDYRLGRRLIPGGNLAVETEHAMQFPRAVSVQVRPRLWTYRGRAPGPSGAAIELLAANARAVRGNVALTVGREYTKWAPAEEGGLFFSDNAPALDMVRIATDAPVRLPTVFGRLGLVAATLQVADLGRSDSNSHSLLVSYKVSARPVDALELGASFENHFGGAGARGASAVDRFIDLVPYLDVFRHHADSTAVDSDKLLGADARLRLAALGNVTLFGELALEDVDFHRLRSIFTEDAAYTTGIIVPAIFTPALSMRVGYRAVGLRFYEHHILRNGISARRLTLGDELGHDASGVFGWVRASAPGGLSVTAEGARDTRRNDEYLGSYTRPGLAGFVFTKVRSVPAEQRTRGVVTLRWFPPDARSMLELRGGVERLTGFAFTGSARQTHGIAGATLAWYP